MLELTRSQLYRRSSICAVTSELGAVQRSTDRKRAMWLCRMMYVGLYTFMPLYTLPFSLVTEGCQLFIL